MKIVCNVITSVSAIAFLLAMCGIDSNPSVSCFVMLVSGLFLAMFGYGYEQKRIEEQRMREGRR